jgi:hypothetical protein
MGSFLDDFQSLINGCALMRRSWRIKVVMPGREPEICELISVERRVLPF